MAPYCTNMTEESITATLVTYHTKISDHPTSYKNGVSDTHLTKNEAVSTAENYNDSKWCDGNMSVNNSEKTVYKGTLDHDSIRESNLSDNVIANYDLAKVNYDAPATVNSMAEDELPEEAWFIYHMGGFQIADRFGEIQE